jgi:ankyrin repeat protein
MTKRLLRRDFMVVTAGAGFAASLSGLLPSSAYRVLAEPALRIGLPGSELAGATIGEQLLRSETDPYRRAVLSGDVHSVEGFLARDPSLLYARDRNGQSVYLLAAYAAQPAVMNLFESKGLVLDVYEAAAGGKMERANELLRGAPGLVRMANPAGDTPVHVAAMCNRSEVIENAIMYGPDFALRNPKRKNSTAPHLGLRSAPQAPAEAMAFAMVGNGLDPNLADADGETVLHSASYTGYPRVIRLLLQKGGQAEARNAAGETPVDIAVAAGHHDAAELLRQAPSIPRDYYVRRFAFNPRFGALQRDDTQGFPKDLINSFTVLSHFGFERVKKLLELCPELLNTRAAWDELPVEAAAHMGREDIGGFLLDRGASYSICTATVFGSLADVKRMLAEDPQRIHERGAHSFPLLFYTAFGKPKIETAEYLIAAGADPNEDMRGRTVLHTAATSGHIDLCRYFLGKGLDPRQKGTSFLGVQDAPEAAEQAKHPEAAAMLRDWSKSHS